MDRLSAIATFVKVVEKGSFAAAADATGLSAPMVGNHVRYLEAHLGGLLLNRTTRRQSLTELGRSFYERSRTILAEFEAAEADALGLHAAPRGLLRITAPHSIGSVLLPLVITAYLAHYPDVEIDLVLSDKRLDMLDEGFDIAIRGGDLPNSGHISRSLSPVHLVVCAAPAYLERAGTPASLQELVEHQCLDFTGSPTPGIWHFQNVAGPVPVAVRGRLRVNSGHAQRRAALDGLGVGLLAEVLVREDIAAGALVHVLPNETPVSRPLYALMLPNRRPSPKVRSFVDFLVTAMAQ